MATDHPSTHSRVSWFRRWFYFGVHEEFSRELDRIEHRRRENLKRFVFRKKIITQADALITVENSARPRPRITIDATVQRLELYSRHDVNQLPQERALEELRKRLPPIEGPADLNKYIGDEADSMNSREIRIIMDRDAARRKRKKAKKAKEAIRIPKVAKKLNDELYLRVSPRVNDDEKVGIANEPQDIKAPTDVSSYSSIQIHDQDDPSQLERYQKLGVITKEKSRAFLQQQREKLEKARQEEAKKVKGEGEPRRREIQRRPIQKPQKRGKQAIRSLHNDGFPIIEDKEGLDFVPENLMCIAHADLRTDGRPISKARKHRIASPAHKNAFFRGRSQSELVKKLSHTSAGSVCREETSGLVSETSMVGCTTLTAKTTTIALRTTTVSEQTITICAERPNRVDGTQQTYQYEPLESVEQFRLLSVEPFAQSQHFTYELRTFSMSNAPSYESVSYVWGQNDRNFTLSFRDSTVLRITRSLFSALPLLSRHCRSGYLWIDQICIDQSNLEERNHQVRYMGNVYKQAKQVFIYLGPKLPVIDPDDLLTLLHHVEKSRYNASTFTTAFRLRSSLEEHIHPDYGSSSHSARHWRDIVRLFQHPWFTRAWVFQELVLSNIVMFAIDQKLASLDAILDLGHVVASLESRSLPNFQHDLCLTRSPGFQQLRLMADVRTRRMTHGSIDPDLFWSILSQVAPICQSSNEQDTLYAFLGLLQDPRIDIWPDYSSTVSDTFTQAASAVTAGQGSLELLAYVDRVPSQSTSRAPLPSWVPDWRLAQSVKIFNWRNFHAAAGRMYEPAFVTDNVQPERCLLARGCIIDRITYVASSSFYSARPWESRNLCSFLNLDEHLARLMRHFGKSLGKPQQVLERLLRVVLADGSERSQFTIHPGKIARFLQTYHRYGHNISQHQTGLDRTNPTIPRPCRLFLRELRQLSRIAFGRRLFATKNLRFGLGPEKAAVGDYICVLHGSSLPVVLHDGKYVKGQCYLEGVMHGEAITWSEDDADEFFIL
jgi:hypothetical protein